MFLLMDFSYAKNKISEDIPTEAVHWIGGTGYSLCKKVITYDDGYKWVEYGDNNTVIILDINNKRVKSSYQCLDENFYYFDQNGIMLRDCTLPDGNKVNLDGKLLTKDGKIFFKGEVNYNYKTKNDEPFLDALYRSNHEGLRLRDDVIVPNKNVYDATRIVYYYPIIIEDNYITFYVLNFEDVNGIPIQKDKISEAMLYIDACRYQLKDDGNWEAISYDNFRDDNEKEACEKAKQAYSYDLNYIFYSDNIIEVDKRRNTPLMPKNDRWYFHKVNKPDNYKDFPGGFYVLSTDIYKFWFTRNEYDTYMQKAKQEQAAQIRENNWQEMQYAKVYANHLASLIEDAKKAMLNSDWTMKKWLENLGYYDVLAEAKKVCSNFSAYYPGFDAY